ncbi:hypothetical protein Pmani_005130 [Petrolisthes manimaculis]|uniref:Uncharacterized protein n=1 Tax=Petrolisthes manimaculis TaxID=1843537 RepID=A0AAE1UMK9_9EUCA|nr:hypothetical protein Pmani_005130 [Petrolisthes manimaculis]
MSTDEEGEMTVLYKRKPSSVLIPATLKVSTANLVDTAETLLRIPAINSEETPESFRLSEMSGLSIPEHYFFPLAGEDKSLDLSALLERAQDHKGSQQKKVVKMVTVAQEMGWLINWGKSKLIPTQSITWLGIQWSTTDSSLSLAPENARNTLNILRRCAFSRTLSRRQELHVVKEWLLKFPTPRGTYIRFDMDNSTAVSCIKRQGTVRPLSQDTVLSFLTWLSSTGNRASATVTSHVSALADPLWFGADIHLERRALSLLSRGIRATSTPGRRNTPRWSLHKVLASVESLTQTQGEDELLMSSLFLLALASGFRASQLAALTRHPNFTSFGENDNYLILAKNERS